MIKVNSYSVKGTKGSLIALPKDLEAEVNMNFLAQALHVYQSRSHGGLSKAKTRGEVEGSTRKIYRQKGTGKARHGAIRAPIFVGGGKAHGPTGLKRVLALPKRKRVSAFKVALTAKAKAGQVVVVNGVSQLKKTSEAGALLEKIRKTESDKNPNGKLTVALAAKNANLHKVFSNIAKVTVTSYDNLNAGNTYLGGLLVIDADAITKPAEKKSK